LKKLYNFKIMFSKKGGKKTIGRMLFSLPVLFIFIFIVGSLACLYAISVMPGSDAFMSFNRSRVMIVQDQVIKNEVYSAVSMLDALNNKVSSGELTMAKAKKLGADLLRDMRYGVDGEGYFFADTTDGVNVVLYGDKSVEGKSRLNDNVNGIFYVKNLIKAGQTASGDFSNYWYPKQGGSVAKEKRAFSLEYKPFGWVVGTGYYLEDIK